MNKLRIILVDDEIFCLETLKWELEQNCPDVEIIAMCQSGTEAIQAIQTLSPDAIFLDIEMPYMNAFEMLQELDTLNFSIVFTTAYDQFAIHAIKVNALDYLLKPIGKDELMVAVNKIKQYQNKNVSQNNLRSLMEHLLANQFEVQKLALPTMNGLELVRIDQIVYVEADSNYSNFNLLSGTRILISKTLKQVEESLKEFDCFIRTHQSYLVNVHLIERYHRGSGGSLDMTNGAEIPVSQSKKDEVLSRLKTTR